MKTITLDLGELAAILVSLNAKDLTYCSQSHIDDYTKAKNKIKDAILNFNKI